MLFVHFTNHFNPTHEVFLKYKIMKITTKMRFSPPPKSWSTVSVTAASKRFSNWLPVRPHRGSTALNDRHPGWDIIIHLVAFWPPVEHYADKLGHKVAQKLSLQPRCRESEAEESMQSLRETNLYSFCLLKMFEVISFELLWDSFASLPVQSEWKKQPRWSLKLPNGQRFPPPFTF